MWFLQILFFEAKPNHLRVKLVESSLRNSVEVVYSRESTQARKDHFLIQQRVIKFARLEASKNANVTDVESF